MDVTTWIIAVDDRRIGGLVEAARSVSEKVEVAAVGSRSLMESLAACGADAIRSFEAADDAPAEAYASQVARAAAEAKVGLILSNDSPAARMIAGAAAGAIDAAVLGSVIALSVDEGAFVAEKSVANGKAVEKVKAQGALSAVWMGADCELPGGSAQIIPMPVDGVEDRVVGFEEATGSNLSSARRVVGVGMGLGVRDNLRIVDDLAAALGAEIACTLPCCDDMRWYPSERVLGSSHNSASPDLYIAVGISGSPNHTSGFRDANVVVAINNDPDAEIFRHSDYGIVGDLFDVVPALTEALR